MTRLKYSRQKTLPEKWKHPGTPRDLYKNIQNRKTTYKTNITENNKIWGNPYQCIEISKILYSISERNIKYLSRSTLRKRPHRKLIFSEERLSLPRKTGRSTVLHKKNHEIWSSRIRYSNTLLTIWTTTIQKNIQSRSKRTAVVKKLRK